MRVTCIVLERDFAFVDQPLDRRARRLRRAASGMCPSPASSPEVGSRPIQPAPGRDLAPGVQVGEVDLGAAGAVERLHVGLSWIR
jgi:hypothetical protein